MHTNSTSKWEPGVRAVLRIAVGLLFIAHGTMKIYGWPPSPTPLPPFDPTTQMGMAGIIEAAGGAAMVLGLLTRVVAFIMCGEMAVAYYLVHFPQGPLPTTNGGELAVLYCIAWLYFTVAGPGALSLDGMIVRAWNSRGDALERRKGNDRRRGIEEEDFVPRRDERQLAHLFR
jgi:putative oxidoreductase